MKKLNIFLSVFIVTALCFWALVGISDTNQYTSVRKYTKPKIKTGTVKTETNTGVQQAPSQKTPEVVVPAASTPAPETKVSPTPKGVDTTPPVIEFLNYKDGDIVTLPLVNILVKVTDNQSAPDKIAIDWAGRQRLIKGFNPIVVTATDEAGNVGSTYIVIEKQ